MLPPNARGKVTCIAPAGEYTLEEKVIEIEFGGVKKSYSMLQTVAGASAEAGGGEDCARTPAVDRAARAGRDVPERAGGTCAIPGAFGCGKTVISQALSKYSNS